MQSLYRKYRPTSFVEVIGQPHVVTTLQNALAHKRVGHAYLFSGPRGTGKTTIARILAKELGTQPLDVIEIDAASNRGIDEARTLKEKVQVVPAQSPYKVFIIDEVHMLTKEAFNALLKTLEEPPAHAVFVLATTEPEKIPETIISRTQRFDFRKISNEKIKEHLLEIAVKEGAELNNDAAAIIAQSSDGAVRDALSILDQIIHSSEDKKISPEQVREILGLPPLTQVQEIVGSFIAKDAKKGIGDIAKLAESGVDFYLLLAHLIEYVRSLLLLVSYPDAAKPPMSEAEEGVMRSQLALISQVQCLKWLSLLFQARENMKVSPVPSLPLEIALLNITGGSIAKNPVSASVMDSDTHEVKKPDTHLEPESGKVVGRASEDAAKTQELKESQTVAEVVNIEPISGIAELGIEDIFSRWSETLISVKQRNFVVGGFLRGGVPVEIKNDALVIACKFPFHKDKILERKNRIQIEEVLEKLFGRKMQIICILESELTQEQRTNLKDKEKEQEIMLTKNALEMFEGKMISE
jgi:DNA polymerase-3 subunit gamma/tau